DEPAMTGGPAAADAGATDAPAAPASTDATADPAADATAPSAAQPAQDGPALVAGTDYIEIPGGQPFAPLEGKIEVVEVFAYSCGACAAFDPLVASWERRL